MVKSVFDLVWSGLVCSIRKIPLCCLYNVFIKGKQRQTMLEKAVSEAQSSESRVQNFQHWIYHVDELLNEHLDNDTTVDDLPHDFQVSARLIHSLFVWSFCHSFRYNQLNKINIKSFFSRKIEGNCKTLIHKISLVHTK